MSKKLQGMSLALLSIGILFVSNTSLTHASVSGANSTRSNSFYHIFGGFGANTPQRASAAASDGINEAQFYDMPADTSSALGQTFQSLRMHEVDTYPWVLLYEYECHRSHVVAHSGSSCSVDYPSMS